MQRIAVEPPRQPEAEELLALGAAYAHSLYPPGACFLLDVATLELPGVTFYVARVHGCAALVTPSQAGADAGELKRMFVRAEARGTGVAGAILGRIESDAPAVGLERIVLETGTRHTAALSFYPRHGYKPVPQFGEYVGEEFSVCFAKDLLPGR
ncbi:GNAT family N-acetyltransferase [Sinomonas halotolerans]|uniref:GNAT family N-acetyltransferase n=1 Tax=Sinomonas halotolerans TaxID=1644133 RepID=A0ABU9WXG9_9MICC